MVYPSNHKEGGFGIFGFAVLTVFWIGFSVLMFGAVCGFYMFLHSVFGFPENSDAVFDFSFLIPLKLKM